jgi:hypothetical protein
VRSALTLTAVLSLAPPPAAAAGVPSPGKAEARLVACHRAERPVDRRLEVEGSMRAAAAGQGLRMRFDLYRRLALGRPFTHLPGPGLGVFYRASTGAGTYSFRKAVRNLAAGDYRVVVTFEWLAADGAVVARAARTAPVCRQPELRPDLQVAAIAVTAGSAPDRAVYEVAVRNRGGSTARGFGVGLTVAGQPQPALTVVELRPGERRTVRVDAPRCPPGADVIAFVDPDHRLAEASEGNNQRSLRCPAAWRAGRL